MLLENSLVEGGWPVGEEKGAALDHAVREGEPEVGSQELLDVRAANVRSLLNLGNTEDLRGKRSALQHQLHSRR